MLKKDPEITHLNHDSIKEINHETPEKKNLENFINKVDFELLKKVFITKLHKVGINTSNINSDFVMREEIFQTPLIQKILSFYNIKGDFENVRDGSAKRIRLNETHVKISEWLKNQDPRTRDSEEFYSSMLSVLCHEEVHAVSHHSCTEWESKNYLLNESSERSGLSVRNIEQHKLFKTTNTSNTFFTLVDEGVTDMMAEEIYNDYSKQQNSIEQRPYVAGYPDARSVLNAFLDKISLECELDREVLWGAIVKSKMLGAQLGDDRVNQLFGDALPEKFWQKLATATPKQKIKPYLLKREVQNSTWSEKDKKRLRRWIRGFVKNDNSDILNEERGMSESETGAKLEEIRKEIENA